MSDPSSRLQAAIADRYRIEHELGRGGMATVYRADDLKHGRKVAIKVILPEVAAAVGLDRFLREIEIAARLTHPHIVPLFDSGAAAGQLYYVMPWIEGETLRTRLERESRLPIEDALRLAREIASALSHAHHQGLVHRDVKPENVLLAHGIALVADFGIARTLATDLDPAAAGGGPGAGGPPQGDAGAAPAHDATASDAPGTRSTRLVTQAGAIIGTPRYMAPEQAMGSGAVDGRADLYALGCVLYEMLCGEPPFTGPHQTLSFQHLSAEPRPVQELRPDVPPAVAAAITRVLAKAPEDRYATAARFAEALAAATRGGLTIGTAADEVAVPNNLPRLRAPFIGREAELAECARRMGGTRLLTVTGIGGCGKTRLALALAGNLLASFPDGVWFVDLAPLADADRLVLTVATALGVAEEPGTPLIDRVVARLRGRRSLVVLDNCEHVLRSAAELAETLLAAGPDLRLVVTSREALAIAGEQVVALRSLSVPAPGTSDARAIGAAESVRLFVDRARRADLRFELDPGNAAAIAEICRRLDGIPLAIELAAARVRMLSVGEILARLDDRFRLLTGGSATALPRHQTMRATLQWSYDHLSAGERALFRALAAFAGGWTLEGAARVAGEGADEFEMLDLLTRLGDKSLLTVERVEGGATRYSMLETVRQFARELLLASGEAASLRDRHLAFYLALAEEAEARLRGPEQGAWLARLGRDRENLIAAHRWCDQAADGGELGLRLVRAAHGHWLRSGLLELGERLTMEALGREAARAATRSRAQALFAAGQLGYFMGRYADAGARLDESLAIARALGDGEQVAASLRALGNVALSLGDRAGARGRFTEALALARGHGDRRRLAAALGALAELERAEGELAAAARHYEECLALFREEGDRANVAIYLVNLATLAMVRGADGEARGRLREGLANAEAGGSRRAVQVVLDAAATLAASAGEWAVAARLRGAGEAQREASGLVPSPIDEALAVERIAGARAALGEAAYAAAVAAGRALPYDEAIATLRDWLAAGA